MSAAGEGVESEGRAPEAAADEALAIEEALVSLEATVGDRGFVAELLDDFLSALPAQLEAMRAACAGSDLEALHRGAHTLRSNAATFGADSLARACRALEDAARGGDAAQTQQLLGCVESEAVRAQPALAAARDERSS